MPAYGDTWKNPWIKVFFTITFHVALRLAPDSQDLKIHGLDGFVHGFGCFFHKSVFWFMAYFFFLSFFF